MPYKDPIKNIFDARWNLCQELKETGAKIGTPTDSAVLFYLVMSAWWGDRYKRKVLGEVDPDHGSPSGIIKWTNLPSSTVYRSLTQLQIAGWIEAAEISAGKIQVVVLLDERARRAREVNRRHPPIPKTGTQFPKRESDSQNGNPIPKTGMATVTDLGKHRLTK